MNVLPKPDIMQRIRRFKRWNHRHPRIPLEVKRRGYRIWTLRHHILPHSNNFQERSPIESVEPNDSESLELAMSVEGVVPVAEVLDGHGFSVGDERIEIVERFVGCLRGGWVAHISCCDYEGGLMGWWWSGNHD